MAVNSPISLMFMHPFILYELLSHCSGSGKAVVNFEFSVEGLWVMKHLADLKNYMNVMSLMQVLPLGLPGLFCQFWFNWCPIALCPLDLDLSL